MDSDTIIMTRHCVFWRPIICKNVRGQDFVSEMADIVSSCYRGTLVSEILKMPRKESISFEEAIRLMHEHKKQAWGHTEKYVSYYDDFVRLVSESGYHIELTGDEFEVVLRPTHPC